MQRGFSEAITCIGVSAVSQEPQRHLEISSLQRVVQWSVPLGVAASGAWLRTRAEQQLYCLNPICAAKEWSASRKLQGKLAASVEAGASSIGISCA